MAAPFTTARQQFVEHIRATLQRAELHPVPAAPNVFMRHCSSCSESMPHYQFVDHCECSVCQMKTFRGEQGSILLEIAFWAGVVLFILLCILGDVPW